MSLEPRRWGFLPECECMRMCRCSCHSSNGAIIHCAPCCGLGSGLHEFFCKPTPQGDGDPRELGETE